MSKFIMVGDNQFKTQTELYNYTRNIIYEIGITESVKKVNQIYFNFLLLLIERHPMYTEKIKNFSDFRIYQDFMNKNALALNIVNKDMSYTTISWICCIKGRGRKKEDMFKQSLRECISEQILDFKNTSDLSQCIKCNCSLNENNIHVDHNSKQFIELVNNFLKMNSHIKMPTIYTKKEKTNQSKFKPEDKWISELFYKYHKENADLRILCKKCNITRKKHKI